MKQRFDSFTYVGVRYFAFIFSSAISAILNIILFASLDSSSKPFLIGFSLTLELAKLISVISMGILGELRDKLSFSKLNNKHRFYCCLYIFYALLSITASLGFSTMVTSKTEATRNLALETMQQQVIDIEAQNNKIQDIINIRDLSKSEYIAEYQSKYEEADSNYRKADLNYANALSARQRLGARNESNEEEWDKLNAEVIASSTLRSTLDRARTEAQRNQSSAISEYETNKRNAESNYTDAEAELKLMVSAAGIETDRPRAAITELKLKLSAMEAENIRNMGMQYVFITWGKFLGTSPERIKFIILIIISLLLEITVFQTAPDIRITRKVLFFFRNSLPRDTDVDNLLNQIEKENSKFDKSVELDKIPVFVPEPIKPGRKRSIQKKQLTIEETEKIVNDVLKGNVPEEKMPDNIIDLMTEKAINDNVKNDPEPPFIQLTEDVPKHTLTSKMKQPEMFNFRYGRSSNNIKDNIVAFLKECCPDQPGKFKVDPSEAAAKLNINDRSRDIFLEKISRLVLDDKPIITSDGLNNWYSNYPLDKIISYSTELLGA